MKSVSEKVKGLGLCSGGLDSILAALVLKKQGVDVTWISFQTPFFNSGNASKASRITGIPLIIKDITDTYLQMLRNPKCGYGKHMNPCMDCHTLMFREAGKIMETIGARFLFSGEVLGQRPMSQTRPSLRYVEKHSGYTGHILRPLSAKCLDETLVEKEGLVIRDELLDITGRGRKRQIELAKEFGITEYPAPAGGCLLTDGGYTRRLQDLFIHDKNNDSSQLHLLRYGRHLRISSQSKLIVGRTQYDNEHIARYADRERDVWIKVKNHPGPLAILVNCTEKDMVKFSAAICAGYSKAPQEAPVQVEISEKGNKEIIEVIPLDTKDLQKYMI